MVFSFLYMFQSKQLLPVALFAIVCWTSVRAADDAQSDAAALARLPILDVPQMEITVPHPPTVLHAGGHRSLCYELYITNTFNKQFTLEKVRTVADNGAILLDSSGPTLLAALPVGKFSPPKEHVLEMKGFERLVFYAWIDLPADAPVPKSIDHALSFKPEHGDSVVVHGGEAPVSDAILTIAPPLRGDGWYAGNAPSNTNHHRRAILSYDGRSYIGQRYAIDWIKIDRAERSIMRR
jgi:hypothetical protein